MRKLIVIWSMVVSELAVADMPPSAQKIMDCQAFMTYLNFLARARRDNWFPPDKLSEKYLKEKYGNKNSLLREAFRFSKPDQEKKIDKIEDIAISMIVHSDRIKLNGYAEAMDPMAICMEYANEIVQWKPISQ